MPAHHKPLYHVRFGLLWLIASALAVPVGLYAAALYTGHLPLWTLIIPGLAVLLAAVRLFQTYTD